LQFGEVGLVQAKDTINWPKKTSLFCWSFRNAENAAISRVSCSFQFVCLRDWKWTKFFWGLGEKNSLRNRKIQESKLLEGVKCTKYRNNKFSCREETVRLLRGSVLAKYKWKRIFCIRPYKSIYNHCDVIGLQRYRIR